MFIVSLTYTSPLEEIERFLPEHITFLDEQYSLKKFLLSGRKVPRTGGVILATAESRDELDAIIANDPFYREGLANYEVTEIIPTKSAAALESLLAK